MTSGHAGRSHRGRKIRWGGTAAFVVLASHALLVGCPSPRAPGATSHALATDAGQDPPLVTFARAHHREVDRRLSPAPNHFLAHEQARPRGFVPFKNGRRPPSHVHHARMIAFNYGWGGACTEGVVQKDGTICDGAVYPGMSLTPEQTTRAAEIMRLALEPAPPAREHSWGARPVIRCFEPHHALVLFDDRGIPVAEMVVCFECGNFLLTPGPGPESEAGMTDAEASFFADTCRTLDVGGCPPPGMNRMPELPPLPEHAAQQGLDGWQGLEVQRIEALARPHGVNESLRLADVAAIDRKLWCAWFGSAQRGVNGGLECADGRTMLLEEQDACVKPTPQTCDATVGDLVTCTRARLGKLCGADPPACVRSDACKRGVVLRK